MTTSGTRMDSRKFLVFWSCPWSSMPKVKRTQSQVYTKSIMPEVKCVQSQVSIIPKVGSPQSQVCPKSSVSKVKCTQNQLCLKSSVSKVKPVFLKKILTVQSSYKGSIDFIKIFKIWFHVSSPPYRRQCPTSMTNNPLCITWSLTRIKYHIN
jgi:hypothetical protein